MKTKQRILKIAKTIILIWGIFSIFAIIMLGIYFLYESTIGNREKIDKATRNDVRFVLNWCEIGDENAIKVLKSYDSPHFFNGDYLTAYKIQIKKIDFEKVLKNSNHPNSKWYKSDQLPEILDETIKLIDANEYHIPWFPNSEKIKSSDFYIYPWSIFTNGISPGGAQIILYNPSENIVYFLVKLISTTANMGNRCTTSVFRRIPINA